MIANTQENYARKPEWVNDQREGVRGVSYIFDGQFTFDELYCRYCETLLALDESIGMIRDYLDESELAESTLLLYTSDHRYSLGESGLIGKQTTYKALFTHKFYRHAPRELTQRWEVTHRVGWRRWKRKRIIAV